MSHDAYSKLSRSSLSCPSGASPYGALDMLGNAEEWVAHWASDDCYTRSPDRNPQGPTSGDGRVLRGGSWGNDVRHVRTAYRVGYPPSVAFDNLGFRCARSGSEP